MIAYFDTSAMMPLVIDEPGTEVARATWQQANRMASAALVYVEARAALARARRAERLTAAQLPNAVKAIEDLYSELDVIAVDDALIREAGELAGSQGLRDYDAVHLAAALGLADLDLVFVAGDAALLEAAASLGLATASVG